MAKYKANLGMPVSEHSQNSFMIGAQEIIQTADENHQRLGLDRKSGQQFIHSIRNQFFIAAGDDIRFLQIQIGQPMLQVLKTGADSAVPPAGKRADKQLLAFRSQHCGADNSPAAVRR